MSDTRKLQVDGREHALQYSLCCCVRMSGKRVRTRYLTDECSFCGCDAGQARPVILPLGSNPVENEDLCNSCARCVATSTSSLHSSSLATPGSTNIAILQLQSCALSYTFSRTQIVLCIVEPELRDCLFICRCSRKRGRRGATFANAGPHLSEHFNAFERSSRVSSISCRTACHQKVGPTECVS